MIRPLNLLMPVVSLLRILTTIVSHHIPLSDVDLKSLVCVAWILMNLHSSMDMHTEEKAKTWSRKAFSLCICSYYFHSVSVC